VVVTGYFGGTVDFGGGPLTSVGSWEIFVAKYDASGVHQWSRRFGDAANDQGYGVAVDALGNVIIAGDFQAIGDFGGGPYWSVGGGDIFVAKYDASGVYQWNLVFGSPGMDHCNAVAVDASGNVVVTGYFYETVDFGGGDLTSAGVYDIFLAKYDASGVHQWSRRIGGTGGERGYAVATDASGNVFVTGFFQGTVDFGGGDLTSVGISDIFVAKYDASGVYQWCQRFGTQERNHGTGIAVDASGNVFVTGRFFEAADFGGGNLTSAGNYDIFLAKYDASGAHQWSQRFGSPGYDYGNGVAVDAMGDVVATGTFEETVDFGDGDVTSAGLSDIYVAKYDGSGVPQWSHCFGDTGADNGYGVAMDALGSAVATGIFEGTVDFGGGDLTSAGWGDVFVAKYGEYGTTPVFFSSFDAVPMGNVIEVTWDFSSDESLDRYTLYRRHGVSAAIALASGETGSTWSYVDTSVEPGETYDYELVIRTTSGEEFRSPVARVTAARLALSLEQNVPNPFNPTTTLSFTLPERAEVKLSIYDAQGRLVAILVSGTIDAGPKKVTWDGRNAGGAPVSSGVYFSCLQVGEQRLARKMILLK